MYMQQILNPGTFSETFKLPVSQAFVTEGTEERRDEGASIVALTL